MAGEVLEYVTKMTNKASPALKEMEKDAKRADQAYDALAESALQAGQGAKQAGRDFKASSAGIRDMNAEVLHMQENAGQSASIISAMGGAIGAVNPAAGSAVSALGAMAGAAEGVGKAITTGLAGPLGAIALVVGGAIAMFAAYTSEAEKNAEALKKAEEAQRVLNETMLKFDVSSAMNSMKLLAAEGKITNREVAEFNALTTVQEQLAPAIDQLMEKRAGTSERLTKAQSALNKATEEWNAVQGQAATSSKAKAAAAYDAATKEFRLAQSADTNVSRQIDKMNAKVTEEADKIMKTFDALAKSSDKTKSKTAAAAKGGASKGPTEFEKLLDAANKMAEPASSKLEQLNAMLITLGQTSAVGAEQQAALNTQIEAVTRARDAELEAYQAGIAKENAAALEKAAAKTESLTGAVDGLVAAYEEPISAADKLRAKKGVFQKQFDQVAEQMKKAGLEGTDAFAEMRIAFENQMNRIQSAINQLEPPDPETFKQKIGAGLAGIGGFLTAGGGADGGGAAGAAAGAVGVMASGGATALTAMAGPAGAAVGGLLSLGQQGDAAYDQAVSEKAQAKADERREQMEGQRQQMLSQGFSEEQIAQQGLSQEDIAEAGQVTEEDIKEAESETDRGEEMAGVVEQAVRGVIEGIKSIIEGLPEILEFLIPALLTDLPVAIITAVFKALPKMIKMLVVKLPVALFKGFVKGFKAIWKAIKKFFKDIFSLGFQTGTSYVPKTGRFILHQGERVLPASGATTGGQEQGLKAFTGGGQKANVTLNASVVDPDTIPALSRIIEKSLGRNGRAESAFFGAQDHVTSI